MLVAICVLTDLSLHSHCSLQAWFPQTVSQLSKTKQRASQMSNTWQDASKIVIPWQCCHKYNTSSLEILLKSKGYQNLMEKPIMMTITQLTASWGYIYCWERPQHDGMQLTPWHLMIATSSSTSFAITKCRLQFAREKNHKLQFASEQSHSLWFVTTCRVEIFIRNTSVWSFLNKPQTQISHICYC